MMERPSANRIVATLLATLVVVVVSTCVPDSVAQPFDGCHDEFGECICIGGCPEDPPPPPPPPPCSLEFTEDSYSGTVDASISWRQTVKEDTADDEPQDLQIRFSGDGDESGYVVLTAPAAFDLVENRGEQLAHEITHTGPVNPVIIDRMKMNVAVYESGTGRFCDRADVGIRVITP